VIRTYDELAHERKQVALLEETLIDWHHELGSKDHRNYELYARSTIDMLLRVRAQIDEFLGIAPAPLGKAASINGAPAETGTGERVKS
jgi:hypothetical protein